MILQDQVIKGSPDFVEGSSSLNVTTLPGLVAKHCGNEDNVFNLSHGLTSPLVQRVV